MPGQIRAHARRRCRIRAPEPVPGAMRCAVSGVHGQGRSHERARTEDAKLGLSEPGGAQPRLRAQGESHAVGGTIDRGARASREVSLDRPEVAVDPESALPLLRREGHEVAVTAEAGLLPEPQHHAFDEVLHEPEVSTAARRQASCRSLGGPDVWAQGAGHRAQRRVLLAPVIAVPVVTDRDRVKPTPRCSRVAHPRCLSTEEPARPVRLAQDPAGAGIPQR